MGCSRRRTGREARCVARQGFGRHVRIVSAVGIGVVVVVVVVVDVETDRHADHQVRKRKDSGAVA